MTNTTTMACVLLLPLLASLLAAPPASAQDGESPETRAPAWPPTSEAQIQRIRHLVRLLRSADSEEAREAAERELVEMGAAAAPALIARLSDSRDDVNEALCRVLDRITAAGHAPLLAAEARGTVRAKRLWVLRRLASFRLPEMAPVFAAAAKERDPEIAFQARLGLLSAGDPAPLPAAFEHAMRSWSRLEERLAEALPGVRGPEATALVLERMADGGERAVVTGLRFLRHVGGRKAARAIAHHLDAESHLVRKETINTLRVLVDGDPPLEELSVFQTVEHVNRWKERLR